MPEAVKEEAADNVDFKPLYKGKANSKKSKTVSKEKKSKKKSRGSSKSTEDIEEELESNVKEEQDAHPEKTFDKEKYICMKYQHMKFLKCKSPHIKNKKEKSNGEVKCAICSKVFMYAYWFHPSD